MTHTLNTNLIYSLIETVTLAAEKTYPLIGKGDKITADQVAVNAMRHALNQIDINGVVVIGEGERDKAPMLYIGERVGTGQGISVDIALDPLEGTNLTAKNHNGALTVIALAPRHTLLNAPDTYMDKIVYSANIPNGLLDLDQDPKQNIKALANAKSTTCDQINVCILERQRHQSIIEAVRQTGAKIRFIDDGDIAAAIDAANPKSQTDLYIGIGGAPEGVLAAAALKAMGGNMQARLKSDDEKQIQRAKKMGIHDFNRKYAINDMVTDDVIFAAAGVTNGLLKPLRTKHNTIKINAIALHYASRSKRSVTITKPL